MGSGMLICFTGIAPVRGAHTPPSIAVATLQAEAQETSKGRREYRRSAPCRYARLSEAEADTGTAANAVHAKLTVLLVERPQVVGF